MALLLLYIVRSLLLATTRRPENPSLRKEPYEKPNNLKFMLFLMTPDVYLPTAEYYAEDMI